MTSANAAARAYCNRIKNKAKQAYAYRYLRYLEEGGPAPQDPPDLSYMAAQAVRQNLIMWRGDIPEPDPCGGINGRLPQ